MKSVGLAIAMAALLASNIAKADEICLKLKSFETAARSDNPVEPQWIDVYWAINDEAIFSSACIHGEKAASGALCEWLVENMSREFSGLLPKRILDCAKTRRNPYGATAFPARATFFAGYQGGRFYLETAHRKDSEKPWMRLTIFPDRRRSDASALPEPVDYKRRVE